MSFRNTLRSALRGITSNKLRAALTTLGIIIGVASVIATLALGNGARAAVEQNFRFLGSDGLQISTRKEVKDGKIVPVGKDLVYEDGLEMPGQVPLVSRVEMTVGSPGKVRHDRNVLDLNITGTTADALVTMASANEYQPANWQGGRALRAADFLGQGRFFTAAEVLGNAPACVLGYQTALDLFEGDDPLGQTVWVSRQRCEVIGVMAELEMQDPSQRNREKPNDALYLPISTAIAGLYDKEPQVSITAHVTDESRMSEAKRQVADFLRSATACSATLTAIGPTTST